MVAIILFILKMESYFLFHQFWVIVVIWKVDLSTNIENFQCYEVADCKNCVKYLCINHGIICHKHNHMVSKLHLSNGSFFFHSSHDWLEHGYLNCVAISTIQYSHVGPEGSEWNDFLLSLCCWFTTDPLAFKCVNASCILIDTQMMMRCQSIEKPKFSSWHIFLHLREIKVDLEKGSEVWLLSMVPSAYEHMWEPVPLYQMIHILLTLKRDLVCF